MKKIFTFIAALSLFASVSMAQNGITIKFKNKTDEAYFKKTDLTYMASGFANEADANTFINKLSASPDVASVKTVSKDDGVYTIEMKMKNEHDKDYYVNMASKMGVVYIVNNAGEKKLVREMMARSNKKEHEHSANDTH